MANENKKDFNAMLADNKDMPKIKIITDEKSIEKYGRSRMYFAPPANYDTVMKQVYPRGSSSLWECFETFLPARQVLTSPTQ